MNLKKLFFNFVENVLIGLLIILAFGLTFEPTTIREFYLVIEDNLLLLGIILSLVFFGNDYLSNDNTREYLKKMEFEQNDFLQSSSFTER